MAPTNITVGARIRALRQQLEMKSSELATSIGLDPSAMSNIESGKRAVKASELGRIAESLGVSVLAILDESSLLARLPVSGRSDTASGEAAPILDRLRSLTELHDVLAAGGIPAEPSLDGAPAGESGRWKQSADELASWATERLTFHDTSDRFASLADAIERDLHVDVLVEDAATSSHLGAAITDWSFPLIFVRASQPRARALFTLAHELGHVLARDGETITLDTDLGGPQEREANAFAAGLLMPEQHVRGTIQDLGFTPDAFATLLLDLQVSFISLVYRLHNLGIINWEGRNRLQAIGMSGLVGSIDEPVLQRQLMTRNAEGASVEPRPPRLLAKRAISGYQMGIVSIRPFAELTDQDPEDLLDENHDFDLQLRQAVGTEADSPDEERYAGVPN